MLDTSPGEGHQGRGWRLAGHPIHPALVHFPLALCPLSVLADIVAWILGEAVWASVAYGCLAAGVVLMMPATLSGWIDYRTLTADHPAQDDASIHMLSMMTAGILFLASLILRLRSVDYGLLSWWALLLSLGGLLAMLVGGWYGGRLVYRHAVGIENPPTSTKGD